MHLNALIAAVLFSTTSMHMARAQEGNSGRHDQITSSPIYNWSGLYAGGFLVGGGGRGTSSAPSSSGTRASETGFINEYAGVMVGFNHALPSRVLVGGELDASFPNFLEGDDLIATRRTPLGVVTEKVDYTATVRGRIGYAFDRMMIYGTGGLAWSQVRLNDSRALALEGERSLHTRLGWALGAGAEVSLDQLWRARIEYLYDHFPSTAYRLPSGGRYETAMDLHAVRLGLTHSIGGAATQPEPATANASASTYGQAWNIHGQSTVIFQGYPSFRSPYEGENSLKGANQIRNTASASAFLGMRLGPGTEFYINPEIYQGFGLSDVHGLAGFPNGEAQKSSFPIPRSNIARLFVRQTFGFGGQQETLGDGPNQLAGRQDVSRLTVTAGKFAVKDHFDVNTYANDPRVGFINWNMYGGGSYDWTMDKLSWSWGAMAELNQRQWAFRTGYFLVPTFSNFNTYDPRAFERGEYVAEIELRHQLMAMPGKVRVFGWTNRAMMGGYADSLAASQLTGDTPDITQTRRARINYGVVVGLEQAVTDDLGVFSRASWSPGKTEIIGWTDVHNSISAGTVLKGTAWGRPADRVGLGLVSQGLSDVGRAFFGAGGLGITIGDGQLNYRRELVVETYYALSLGKLGTFSLDYQHINNPAYNTDRGPVSVYSTRFHTEF